MNSWKDDGVTTSPWLHPEALPAIRDALRLRLRLMPYLYSAIVSAHEAHTPVLAPTFVAFEDDSACFADADAAMFGPCLLAAPALHDGAREIEVYLPRGPESWRDFWTGRVYAAGQIATIPAPLDRLPLLAPAGAIVAMTDNGDDYSRLHDEPSRGLRVFPGTADGASRAVLIEDDGISLVGASARVAIALSWTASRVCVEAGASGNYTLPYQEMRVILPEDETRTVELSGADGIGLRL
jgi:alpha-glucosidase